MKKREFTPFSLSPISYYVSTSHYINYQKIFIYQECFLFPFYTLLLLYMGQDWLATVIWGSNRNKILYVDHYDGAKEREGEKEEGEGRKEQTQSRALRAACFKELIWARYTRHRHYYTQHFYKSLYGHLLFTSALRKKIYKVLANILSDTLDNLSQLYFRKCSQLLWLYSKLCN